MVLKHMRSLKKSLMRIAYQRIAQNAAAMLAALAWGTGLIAAAAPGATNEANLIGYWPLDGKAEAAVGVKGEMVGDPSATVDHLGNAHGAMQFDGARRQCVRIPGGGGLDDRSKGTISLWVRWDSHNQPSGAGQIVFGTVLARQKDGVWSSNLLGLSGPDPGSAVVRWRSSFQEEIALDGVTRPEGGHWHHVAVTFAPDQQTLYVDGKMEALEPAAGPLWSDPAIPLTLGAWAGQGNCFATASLDDLAIWDEVLSPEQIGALARGTATPRTPFPKEDLSQWRRAALAGVEWPAGVVFVSGYVPMEPVGFPPVWIGRSRAYFELDHLSPSAVGHQLFSLVPAKPEGELRLLHDAGQGVLGAPSVSYDGKTILFAMATASEKLFHIYAVQSDGANLRCLTRGPFHDYDPAMLPDGRIVFSSTRIGNRDEYHGNLASALFTMNADGTEIHPLTHHIIGDHEPKVTADGGIAFIRRDNFIERAKVESRIQLIRRDGTGGVVLCGADRGAVGLDPGPAAERNADWLRIFGAGCPTPLPDGRVAAISNNGLVLSGLLDSGVSSFERIRTTQPPFDIAALPDGRLLCTSARRNWLGIMDPAQGRVTPFYTSTNIHSPVFLGPRPCPLTIAPQIDVAEADQPGQTGFLLCQDVFRTKQTHADLSRIKAVRIFEGRPMKVRSVRHALVHLGVEAVELGSVPLAADGSFYVRVPSDRPLAIQAVDAEGRNVITELSWLYVRPGERLSCVGCHQPRTASPKPSSALAARSPPISLLGQGQAYRYRANNAANGGMLNLQLDRFREAASIDLYTQSAVAGTQTEVPLPPGRSTEVKRLCQQMVSGPADLRISAAQRLAILRDRTAVSVLAKALTDTSVEVRVSSALALAACGDRRAIEPLLAGLSDAHPLAAQAANVALEQLTGQSIAFDAFAEASHRRGAAAWQTWFGTTSWAAIEARLVKDLAATNRLTRHQAIEALGHVGGQPAKAALREYLVRHPNEELRQMMSAIRALGYLRDENAVPLLAGVLRENIKKDPGPAPDLHELGWLQKPGYLAATAAEALGWIGTPKAEQALLEILPKLSEFWVYTLQNGDHEWLKGCHSSVIHYRIIEALDAIGSRQLHPITATILRSVPIDPDRALLLESDSYESLCGRAMQRNGLGPLVVETCLAVLGDRAAHPAEDLWNAVTNSPPALEVRAHDPEARAAQILSVVCLDARPAARIRAALERYRATPPSRTRSYVCFFLARTLGKVQDAGAVDTLLGLLNQDPTEASFGYEDPPHVFIHKALAPFYRAAAAYALGEIGDRRAVPSLLRTLENFDNALDVRFTAAVALDRLCSTEDLPRLHQVADGYPEVSTRYALLETCARLKTQSLDK